MSLADRVNAGLRRVPVWPFYVLGLAPAAIYFWLALQNRLGADPVKALEHEYGLLALQLLIAALAVTPLREQTGISLLRFRRCIGLMAYYYVLMHIAVWVVLDRQLAWPQVVADLTKRPYIIIGMAAALLLTPLALTSTNAALRRLGPLVWRRIHRLAYPATALAAIHFVWLVKAWPPEPLLYAAGVAALLLYRALPRSVRTWGRAPARGRA